jgi:hypothetical protein
MSFTITKTVGSVTIGVEADKTTDAFKDLSSLEEVFGISCCGKCACEDLSHVVRKDAEENEYYELRCTNRDCRAKLAFGLHKKGGGMYPKRKDKDDKWLPDGGWMRWDADKKKEV